MSDFQLIVIGAGPGGYVAALRAAKLGIKTAVVENRQVGGTCLNRGCIPTKTLLHSSSLAAAARGGAPFGVSAQVEVDLAGIYARKDAVGETLRNGILQQFKAAKVTLLSGTGTILAPGRVQVQEAEGLREYTADDILIATGSVPARPPIPGLDLPGVVTSDELLSGAETLYASLVIIGGGVIGVELACFYLDLGCRVTIVEALDRLLPTLDRELSQSVSMLLKKRGAEICTGYQVASLEQTADGLAVHCIHQEQPETRTAEAVLCAIGRKPFTGGLLGPGVSPEQERGRIVVSERFETSLPHVYAIGDVSSRIQLAHVASAQGIAVAEHLAGLPSVTDLNAVPSCIYTDPEIATVGLTADEAKAQGYAVMAGKALMSANGKTVIQQGERGFMKIVADRDTGVILGAQLLCERATDLISELTCAVANGLTVQQLRRVMRPHPTFGEALSGALEAMK